MVVNEMIECRAPAPKQLLSLSLEPPQSSFYSFLDTVGERKNVDHLSCQLHLFDSADLPATWSLLLSTYSSSTATFCRLVLST